MRTSSLACGLFCLSLAIPQAFAAQGAFSFWTMPARPSANEPWTLVFEARVVGGRDLDPVTEPEATVAGGRIVVDLNTECSNQGCDVLGNAIFRVEISGVPEGEYPVAYVDAFGSHEFSTDIVVSVSAEPSASDPIPTLASGFWYAPSNPGTGFHFDVSGDSHVGFSVLDAESRFDRLEPIWRIDHTRYHDEGFVGAPRLRRSQNPGVGNCFACPPGSAEPTFNIATRAFRIRAVSHRRALVDLSSGETIPIVALPSGRRFLSARLVDRDDAMFGPLPIPDVRGRWIFDLPTGVEEIVFDSFEMSPGVVVFSGGPHRLTCREGSASSAASCTLSGLESEREVVAQLGNVSDNVIFYDAGDGNGLLYARRFEMTP
jgi:hypothetical protein